jgi:hypothetical protein
MRYTKEDGNTGAHQYQGLSGEGEGEGHRSRAERFGHKIVT